MPTNRLIRKLFEVGIRGKIEEKMTEGSAPDRYKQRVQVRDYKSLGTWPKYMEKENQPQVTRLYVTLGGLST